MINKTVEHIRKRLKTEAKLETAIIKDNGIYIFIKSKYILPVYIVEEYIDHNYIIGYIIDTKENKTFTEIKDTPVNIYLAGIKRTNQITDIILQTLSYRKNLKN